MGPASPNVAWLGWPRLGNAVSNRHERDSWHMPLGILIGLGSGLASALLCFSAAHGSPLLSTLLLLLTPLPSLLAGLGWGWLSAAAGAGLGMLVMGTLHSPSFAVGYFLALGLPVVLTSYLAYLSRPMPADPTQREWYPAGRLLAVVSLYGGALPILVLPLIGGSYDILRAPMAEFLRRISARTAADLNVKPLDDPRIDALAEYFTSVLPGVLAAYWLAVFVLNLYLAGRIARASGQFGRDWPDLASLAYPAVFPFLVAAALAASFAPGFPGVTGTSFSGALLLAYLLAGLALMHFIARARVSWLLWPVYIGLLLFGPYVAFALMLAGMLEPALKLRQRLGAPPPTT
jgi:hypothetical protein